MHFLPKSQNGKNNILLSFLITNTIQSNLIEQRYEKNKQKRSFYTTFGLTVSFQKEALVQY